MFVTQIVELVKSGSLTNFEQFRYSRTFLKKFLKVENQAKKFFTSVDVSLQARSMKLILTNFRLQGFFHICKKCSRLPKLLKIRQGALFNLLYNLSKKLRGKKKSGNPYFQPPFKLDS